MPRLFLTFAGLFCTLSAASASFSMPQAQPVLGRDLSRVWRVDGQAEQKKELTINSETEVKLDGQTCKYEDLPANVEVILIDVDRKIVRKIHFRTKK